MACAGSLPSAQPVDEDDGAVPASDAVAVPTPASTINEVEPPVSRLLGEPDPSLTPGQLNPDVSQQMIYSTICVAGWTTGIRPSTSETNRFKAMQLGEYLARDGAAFGYIDENLGGYEEDHLIPLQLGGAPDNGDNLWPEPYSLTLPGEGPVGARVKDAFETQLKRLVCAGDLSLAEAQARIGDDWVHNYYGVRYPSAPGDP